MPPKSDMWNHFTRLTDDNGKTIDQAKCNSCDTVLKQESGNGTSNLWRHFNNFHKQQEDGAVRASRSHEQQEDGTVGASLSPAPPTCNPSGSGDGASKDTKPVMKEADDANRWLARMIAESGYDPAIVLDMNFWFFTHCLNPAFKMPSLRVIEEICDSIPNLSWDDIYDDYDTCGNLSLSVGKAKTMDREVLYIACYYIGGDSECQYFWKKVRWAYEVALAPRDEYSHGPLSGLPVASLELVASNIVSEIPKGAGVFMMACEKTDVNFVHMLNERIKQALGCRMSKEPFCATYMDQVIHSIARCLLPELDFTKRMYSAVNNLKLTRQGRQDVLKAHELHDPWEYNELWYSCYCSLEVLRKGCSSEIATPDFEVIGILCDVWGKFYGAIKRISDPGHLPTSHLCLAELFKLREALKSELEPATVCFVLDGLRRAIAALDEAIQDSYMIWSIPLALDPRYKLEYIEFIFETTFSSEVAGDYIANVKGSIKDLYSNYDNGNYCTINTNVGNTERVQQAWNKRRRGQAKTDLDRYLQDTLVPEEAFEFSYDGSIIQWWQSVGSEVYPNVAQMARDALALPTNSRLSSMQIAQVQSIIRGYSARREEEEEEEGKNNDDSNGNVDAMIQELTYQGQPNQASLLTISSHPSMS